MKGNEETRYIANPETGFLYVTRSKTEHEATRAATGTALPAWEELEVMRDFYAEQLWESLADEEFYASVQRRRAALEREED